MEVIWQYIFYDEFYVFLEEYFVLLIEVLLNLKVNREKMMQIMFEKFNIFVIYIVNQVVLVLLFICCMIGIVLNFGFGIFYLVFIYQGYVIFYVIMRLNFVGCDLIDYFECIFIE